MSSAKQSPVRCDVLLLDGGLSERLAGEQLGVSSTFSLAVADRPPLRGCASAKLTASRLHVHIHTPQFAICDRAALLAVQDPRANIRQTSRVAPLFIVGPQN